MKINLSDIRIDGGTQQRAAIHEDTVADYAAMIDDLPPILVFRDGVDLWLVDGFHRFHAARRAGRTEIEATVEDGAQRDAVLASVGVNAAHGLRRTNDDKRKAVLTLLKDEEWGKWSDREIARQCCVHHQMVGKTRSSLDESSSVTQNRRVYKDRDGNIATMQTANIGTKAEARPSAPPPPKPAVRDAIGLRPDHRVLWAFQGDDAGCADELIRAIDSIAGQCREFSKGNYGVFVKGQEVDRALKEARRIIKFGRPHTTCPMCRGGGCKACSSVGWVPEDIYKRMSGEVRAMHEAGDA